MALDIATGLGMGLELGLEGLDLFLGQTGAGEILSVFLVVHDRLVVEVHHIEWGLRVKVAVHGLDHGGRSHGRVKGHGLFERDASMAGERIRMVDVVHCANSAGLAAGEIG